MYLIVGLGNPESDYSNTRHNMGFDVINQVAKKNKIETNKKKFKSLVGKGNIDNQDVILLKPQTYMNASGEALIECMNFYKIPIENIIVIYDDMDIEPGIIKLRKQGGPGSHNGMKSVIDKIGTQKFNRIRIGIGKPENSYDKINYVLGAINKKDRELLNEAIIDAAEAVEGIIKDGIEIAMTNFNTNKKDGEE